MNAASHAPKLLRSTALYRIILEYIHSAEHVLKLGPADLRSLRGPEQIDRTDPRGMVISFWFTYEISMS